MTEALDLSSKPIVLEFNIAASGPPTIEPLADGRIVFNIEATGSVSSALDGMLSAAITEVNPRAGALFQAISVTFIIETDQGTFQGYYAGTIYIPESADVADVN